MNGQSPADGGPLERLRASPEPLRALVRGYLEHLATRPLATLVDVGQCSAEIAEGMRAMAREPANTAWLGARLEAALAALPAAAADDTPLQQRLPEAALEPLRQLVAQPVVIEEQLAIRLLDHPAFHSLVRELLTKSLLDYTRDIAELFPGGKLFTGLMGKVRILAAAGMGDGAGRLEDRAIEFVEGALGPSINRVAGHLADRDFAASISDWRAHIVDILLEQRSATLLTLLQQADAGAIAEQSGALIAAFAAWDQLEATITAALESALSRAATMTPRALLAGSSLEQDWLPLAENRLVEAIWPFLHSDALGQWFGELLAPSRHR